MEKFDWDTAGGLTPSEKEQKRLQHELAVASDIQRALLPQDTPTLEGYEVAALNLQCKEIGGDYYDFIALNEDKILFAVADVVGHGIPAALLMANVQASLRAEAKRWPMVNEIIQETNFSLCHSTEHGRFVTIFCGILGIKDGSFSYCCAGHNPPLLLRADSDTVHLDTGGMVIGVEESLIYESAEVKLNSRDILILYTDGVTEAESVTQEQFGLSRLEGTVREHASLPADKLLEVVVEQLRKHSLGSGSLRDDATLMIIKVK